MSGLELRYFVLKPKGNNIHAYASRAAMKIYASIVESENPEFAQDLFNWVNSEEAKAGLERKSD